jgi:putative endonuclease
MDKKYKKMINVMLERESTSKKKRPSYFSQGFHSPKAHNPVGQSLISSRSENWFLYILKCSDGSFYTGITKDIERRLKMHNDGKASKYTRTRRPVELSYQENCGTRAQALVRECKIKSFSKERKMKLILQ